MPSLNIDLDYFEHPKTRRLIGLLGKGSEVLPIRLWAYTGKVHAEDGRLAGYSAQEIESLVQWWGSPGEMVDAMVKIGLLDQAEDGYAVHDWHEHEGHLWALRVRAKKGAKARWARLAGESDAYGNATSNPTSTTTSNAVSNPPPKPPKPPKLARPPTSESSGLGITGVTVPPPPVVEGVVDAFLSGEPEHAKNRTGLLEVATAAWTACQNVAPIRKAFEQLEDWCASDNPPRAIVEAARTILDRTTEQFKKVEAEVSLALQKAAAMHADMEVAKERSQTPEALVAREKAMAEIKQTLGMKP